MNSRRLQTLRVTCLTILLIIVTGRVLAHIPLTPEILDDTFQALQQAQATADRETDTVSQAAAVYDIAIQATNLTTLLNQEISLHGTGQQSLLDNAVSQAAGLGVEITWSEDHQRYFYNGSAYRRYVELAPEGLNAANSYYQLIETGFFHGNADDREELAARTAVESDFLKRYPDFGNATRVAMFLGIDYRDLWRICRAIGDHDCTRNYAKLNRAHLDAVSIRYADSRTGELARILLQRFEAEIAATE